MGAVLLTFAAYWLSLTGLSPMFAQIAHGDPAAVAVAVMAGAGVICAAAGLAAAFTHDDPFRVESFVWSVAVLTLGVYALRHHWVLTDSACAYHASRACWFAWMASNAVNVWLQLRGSFGRRQPVVTMQRPQVPRLRRRRVTTEWLEELEGRGIEPCVLAGNSAVQLPHRISPDVIEQGGALPELVYVKRGDAFVPIPDAMPVDRRQR